MSAFRNATISYSVHQTTFMNILVPTTVPPLASICFTLLQHLSFFFALHSLNTQVSFKMKCFVHWPSHSLRHLKRVNCLQLYICTQISPKCLNELMSNNVNVIITKCRVIHLGRRVIPKVEDCILIGCGSKREASMQGWATRYNLLMQYYRNQCNLSYIRPFHTRTAMSNLFDIMRCTQEQCTHFTDRSQDQRDCRRKLFFFVSRKSVLNQTDKTNRIS